MKIKALTLISLSVSVLVNSMAQDIPPATEVAPAPQGTVSQSTNESKTPLFSEERLEQIVAPIALYPDNLLAQILVASTYPLDIVEAARWIKGNPSLSQDEIKSELQYKRWDASVKGLVFFPKLLDRMNDNLDWTKDLGTAFVNQQKAVMHTVQKMRGMAQKAGTLKSNSNQSVTDQDGEIQIQSSSPDTIYVENYLPTTSYGTNWNYGGDWYYPLIITAPAWPWGFYGFDWAIGYNCYWRGGWIAYNNYYWNNWRNWNWHNDDWRYINPHIYGPHNLYDPKNPNNQWKHNFNHAKPIVPSVRQVARELDTGKTLQSPVISEHNLPNRNLDYSHNHPFNASRNGDLERSFSQRGYNSRVSSGNLDFNSYHNFNAYHPSFSSGNFHPDAFHSGAGFHGGGFHGGGFHGGGFHGGGFHGGGFHGGGRR